VLVKAVQVIVETLISQINFWNRTQFSILLLLDAGIGITDLREHRGARCDAKYP
jgi:hypothetical protein